MSLVCSTCPTLTSGGTGTTPRCIPTSGKEASARASFCVGLIVSREHGDPLSKRLGGVFSSEYCRPAKFLVSGLDTRR